MAPVASFRPPDHLIAIVEVASTLIFDVAIVYAFFKQTLAVARLGSEDRIRCYAT